MPEDTTTEGALGQGELPLLANGQHAALSPTTRYVAVVFIHDCQRDQQVVGVRTPGQHSYTYVPAEQQQGSS